MGLAKLGGVLEIVTDNLNSGKRSHSWFRKLHVSDDDSRTAVQYPSCEGCFGLIGGRS